MFAIAAVVSLLIFIAVVAAYMRSPFFSAFHPFSLYALFHAVVFVLRPILSLFLNYDYVYRAYLFTPTEQERVIALMAANLGFVTFAFFSMRPGSGGVAMRFSSDPLLQDERYRLARYFVWAMVICTPIAVWSLSTQFGATFNNDAFADMVLDRATGVAYNTSGSGYFYEAQLMLVPLTTIVAWVFRFRLLALLPFAAFFLVRAGTGGRGPFVSAAFALGLFYLYQNRSKIPTARVTAALVALGVVFSVIGYDRGYALRTALGAETDSTLGVRQEEPFLGGMDFSNMEYLEYVIYVVPQRSHSYTYFTEVLQLFTEPIPRVMWPGKPLGPPIKFFSMFDYGNPIGATWSLPGVGWMGLGWLGVIILCGTWGYVLGWIYRLFVQSDQSTFKVAAYMCFLPIMVVAYRDGVIVTVFRQAIFYLFPVLLWIGIARLFKVPMARDLRQAISRLRRRDAVHGAHGRDQGSLGHEPMSASADPLMGLPPAVRRRRLALANARKGDPA